MSKKRARRTAAIFLAMFLTCGSTYNAIAAEAERAFTENMVMSGDFTAEEQDEATSAEPSDTDQEMQQEEDIVQQDSSVEDGLDLPDEEEADPEKSDSADTADTAAAASTEDVETAVEVESTNPQDAGTQAEATEEALIEEKLEDPIEALEAGNTKASINATEAYIYVMDDGWKDGLSIPKELPTDHQIRITGYSGKITYKILSGLAHVEINKDGHVTPADYGDFYSYGDSVIRVTAGSDTFDVTIHVIDYEI